MKAHHSSLISSQIRKIFVAITLISAIPISAQAGVNLDGLKNYINARKRTVSNPGIEQGITLEKYKLMRRVNLAALYPLDHSGRASSESEEGLIRAFIRTRSPLYRENPLLLIADSRALLNEAISATSVLQRELRILEKIKPGMKLTPRYLGPNVFINILVTEIFDKIPYGSVTHILSVEEQRHLSQILATKISALENTWVGTNEIKIGPKGASSIQNPEKFRIHQAFLKKHINQFSDWLTFKDFDTQMDNLQFELAKIQPSSQAQTMGATAMNERNLSRLIPSNGGMTVNTLARAQERLSPIDALTEVIYNIIPPEEKRGILRLDITEILESIHVNLWFNAPTEDAESFAPRNPDLVTALEKKEGKPLLLVNDGLESTFTGPKALSAAHQDWFFLQVDRMIRNDSDTINQYFGQFKPNWDEYSSRLRETLVRASLDDLLSGSELNRAFMTLVENSGIQSSSRLDDLILFAEIDYLRTVSSPNEFWELLYGIKRGDRPLRNEETAKIFRFVYENSDAVTRFQFNQLLYETLFEGSSGQQYVKALSKRYGKEVAENMISFSTYLVSDPSARISIFEDFIKAVHSMERGTQKADDFLKRMQASLSSFFMEGASQYTWDPPINPLSKCLRSTQ